MNNSVKIHLLIGRELLTNFLARPRYRISRQSEDYKKMRQFLLYVIHPTEIPDVYIALNRHYKPLGYTRQEWVIYGEMVGFHIMRPDWLVQHKNGIIPLFQDHTAPWVSRKMADNYLLKLDKLVSI